MADKIKTALVTGGSRGIGRGICVKLAAELGYHVLVNYTAGADAADETSKLIGEAGGTSETIQFDVSNREQVESALTAWEEANPENVIEVIVNNAGVTKDGLFMVMEPDNWHKVLDVSLNGFYNVTHSLISKMVRNRYGRIINVVSVSGVMGNAGQVNYSAAKAGMIGATKALAKEIARRNVTVNAVAPGFIRTDMTKDFNEKEMAGMIPMKRFGDVDEVADAVIFLASPKASYITGNVINVNGGVFT